MSSARVRSLINQLDSTVYCTACEPPVPVEVRARVFYRMHDHDLVSCPNGHQGTLGDYKRAASNPGKPAGPFILEQQGGIRLRLVGKGK